MLLVTGIKLNLPVFWCLATASAGAYCNRTADTSLTAHIISRKRRKPAQIKSTNCKCTKYKWTG
jgi:hypothetical protein